MFTEDLSPFFDVAGGFAQTATVGGSSFAVIFDKAYVSALGGMVESIGPACMAKSSDVSSVVQGTTITIDAVAYTVTGVEPDGTGITVLQLRG